MSTSRQTNDVEIGSDKKSVLTKVLKDKDEETNSLNQVFNCEYLCK